VFRASIASCIAALLLVPHARCGEPAVPDAKVVPLVDARLAEWWLKPDERRFDLIGWAADVRAARKLAAESGRPVFLFTMDGRVNTGRC
jgi:hypothetical protein